MTSRTSAVARAADREIGTTAQAQPRIESAYRQAKTTSVSRAPPSHIGIPVTSGAIGVRNTWSAENGGSLSPSWRNVSQ